MPKPSEARQKAILERLDKFSRFTDSNIAIPFTNIKIGAEAVIGLLPVVGDAVGLVLGGYVLVEAQRAGASKDVKLRMLRNMGIDFLGGLLPVIGDGFDAVYKANTRNTRLLRNYLEKELAIEPPPPPFPWMTVIWLSVLFAVVTGGLTLIL
ncbi:MULTISPECIES: DUF4112 domain-containing protein [Marinobacter]|jgi:hypothetical protein|uniref:DUF4112 domain-containing protein n=2 Tax=Marinobacter TaxID=2742 RepID=G6YSD1_9GAMM|nr:MULTISPECIES: DUF4112 domain-containing protein [Marinobacter]MCP4062755.1 DUF4112 domain-containing protein [Gammaproteobacteria bacterium]EHJ04875.1 hypothetical protein KYE_08858 [Marinobacter manganoxydans MnI7-9]MAK47896.1 DUF4112 domain-containing protein [Marinobacter sp.]MTI76511.1 DUF4112 domain-containing protein [Marinobacter sp.]PHS47101.1 MAG: DUF4112 domain-containing protein [Marinobacter sp.]|tara:strand:- start:356 stop:811 length:456 start_codon:yes stop_codon:yes gene_type:complete